jgi:hypothetical protein
MRANLSLRVGIQSKVPKLDHMVRTVSVSGQTGRLMHRTAHYEFYNAGEAVSHTAVSELPDVHSIHQAATDYFQSGRSVSKQRTYSIHMTHHQSAKQAHDAFTVATPRWVVYGHAELGEWVSNAPGDTKTAVTVCPGQSGKEGDSKQNVQSGRGEGDLKQNV